jgi:glycosyltransferase involved in cell wall biosynthesis
LIGDLDTRPFKDLLGWDSVSFFTSDVSKVNKMIDRFSDDELLEMGKRAKIFYEQHLSYGKWCRHVIEILNKNMISQKDINKIADESEVTWGRSHKLFYPIIEEKGLNVGIEVGVAFGGHAEEILKNSHIKKLYGIDPYLHMENYDDPMNFPQEEFDKIYEFVLSRMRKFGKRYEHIRKSSKEASNIINNAIDFVYIDADHSYEGVKKDLNIWFPRVRGGGVIGGHDYGHGNFPGVKKAVDEFFHSRCMRIHNEEEGVWWVEKRMENLSFFIPAYNCAETIEETVMSIIDGNMIDGDEVVIVNDGSTDDTAEILASLAEKYAFINVIEHEENKGGAAARNTAVQNTKNDILFCLDSDNLLVSGSIQRLKEYMFKENADAAAFGELHYFTGNKRNVTHKWIYHSGINMFADCLAGGVSPASSGNYMFTKESWEKAGGYPEFAKALDAWGFGLRQLATGSKLVCLENTYYLHRYGHESYWVRASAEKNELSFKIVEPFFDQIKEDDREYIITNKRSWFSDLDRRAINVIGEANGRNGSVKKKLSIKNIFRKLFRI